MIHDTYIYINIMMCKHNSVSNKTTNNTLFVTKQIRINTLLLRTVTNFGYSDTKEQKRDPIRIRDTYINL